MSTDSSMVFLGSAEGTESIPHTRDEARLNYHVFSLSHSLTLTYSPTLTHPLSLTVSLSISHSIGVCLSVCLSVCFSLISLSHSHTHSHTLCLSHILSLSLLRGFGFVDGLQYKRVLDASYLPMTTPPRPWTAVRAGAYFTLPSQSPAP